MLFHLHRLEAPFQRCILLNIFAVFVEGGCANHLDFATGQGGLEDIRRVHGALCIAGAHEIVHLINEEDNIAVLFYLFNQALDAAFKLAAELRACNERGQVKQVQLLISQPRGHLTVCHAQREALRNGGFANARLADEAGGCFFVRRQRICTTR